MVRLESKFSEALLKLEVSNTKNTEEIINKIETKSCDANKVKGSANKNSTDTCTISSLETKLRNIKDENKSLEYQLQLEKSNSMLLKEQYEQALAHEKSLTRDARDQLMKSLATASSEQELCEKRLKEKNNEIESLSRTVTDLSTKLNNSRDEVIQMKVQFAATTESTTSPVNITHGAQPPKPTVLLVGTSNLKGINQTKLTNAADVYKEIKYTMKEAAEYLLALSDPPTILVFHLLTNDLKSKGPQMCVDELFVLASKMCAKWPLCKLIISFTTPRSDSMNNSTTAQIINVLLKQKFSGVDNIHFAEHNNMFINGYPNKDLLCDDGYHLNDKGISLLAGNLKRVIHSVLEIPLPSRRPRSTSRSRRPDKGRGRGQRPNIDGN